MKLFKLFLCVLFCCTLSLSTVGCKEKPPTEEELNAEADAATAADADDASTDE